MWGDEVGACGAFVGGEAGGVEGLPVERSAGQLDVLVPGQGGVGVGAVVVGLVDPGPVCSVMRSGCQPARGATPVSGRPIPRREGGDVPGRRGVFAGPAGR